VKHSLVQLTIVGQSGNYEYVLRNTGKDGVAVFSFDQAPPPEIWTVLLKDFNCNKGEVFKTSEVLNQGIGADYEEYLCGPSSVAYPKPERGEIVLPVRQLNFWQRHRRAMEE